jgi:hypothetical protein
MSVEAARKRAQQMACRLTDPSTKKSSFYCTVRRHAKQYGSEFGIVLELRKPTLSKWVEEYLYSVFVRDLPVKEEKALINHLRIVNHIMEKNIPEHAKKVALRIHECTETCTCSSSRAYYTPGGKVPKRGGYGN